MGSKRVMLNNGLGDILLAQTKPATRMVDLFCGAGSVSWFIASHLNKPVLACDLQQYAVILAGSVVKRIKSVDVEEIDKLWLIQAERIRAKLKGWDEAEKLDNARYSTAKWRRCAQQLCSSDSTAESPLVWRCYGGHYYSPSQALTFDSMLRSLPVDETHRELCLAAVIIAAGNCAAAPGHTAQPFKATQTAGSYLREAWLRDPFSYVRKALKTLCQIHAKKRGEVRVGDANKIAKDLNPTDVVFVDPPYSSVQYSRFYHVLETIARLSCGKVDGVGRYPPPEERPNSAYSKKRTSTKVITDLLRTLSTNGCKVVVTFPKDQSSNGLSGDKLHSIACEFYNVTLHSIMSTFSTLGGNRSNRDARKVSSELILILRPR
ncbi:MAG: DNA adenine methylase [Gemmatimonadota bacterium]|nr:DNA adenine methylase [Gemmatimonadota bacterium]